MSIKLITGPANAGKAGVVMDGLRAHRARGERPLLVVPTRADVERYRLELDRHESNRHDFDRHESDRYELDPHESGRLDLDRHGLDPHESGRLDLDRHGLDPHESGRLDLDRHGLAPEGDASGARVERFAGLLAEVLRRAGGTEQPLGRLARERALAAVIRRATGERPTAGVVRSLATLVGELEVERVTPQRLRKALDAWAAADPAHAHHAGVLGELFEEYSRALERLRPVRVNPERQAARALDALRRAPALWGSTPVLLYGFDDFTRLQRDAIETLGAVVGAPVTVSLTYESGRTAFAARGDTFQRLLPLAAEHLRLPSRAEHYAPGAHIALHHLERYIFEPDAPAPVHAGEALRLLEGGGERAELELVAEEIRGLLERGVSPGEIAVVHRSPGSIAELLEEIFRAHRIPFALRRRLLFAHTATGSALLGLLKASFPDEEDGGVGDLLAWLRSPGVLRRPELADELEWRARRAGVGSVARARALWESEHWPLEPLDRLQEAADRGPAALIERMAAELERLGYAQRAPSDGDAGGSPPPVESQLRQIYAEGDARQRETRALQVAGAALMELRELARSAPKLAPDAHELIALLRGLELVVGGESESGSIDPEVARVPDGASPLPPAAVAVLDPLALRARRVRALFLCGLQESVFPAPARPAPYLSAEERRGLAEASGLLVDPQSAGGSGDALAAERYLLYAAVSRPWELLALSWHTADDDGLPTPRSLFVDDICDLFTSDLHETRSRRALGEVSPPVQAGVTPGKIATSGEAASSEEIDSSGGAASSEEIASPGEAASSEGIDSSGEAASSEEIASPGEAASSEGIDSSGEAASSEEIASPGEAASSEGIDSSGEAASSEEIASPGEAASSEGIDSSGRIAPLRAPRVLAQLREQLWSASGLQSWAGCPVQWFVERMLSARDLEPEAEPLARGGLAHAVLRRTLERLREDTGSAQLTAERLPRARELLHEALEEHAGEYPLSTAPERVPGVRRRLEADLERYLEHAAVCGDRAQDQDQQLDLSETGGASQLEPTHLELPFGFSEPPGGLPPLDIGEGVLVRGFIDRVDLAPGGEAVVYDYKSGFAAPPDRWQSERNFQIALYMRAVEQLLNARVVGGFYQPLSGRDLRARGVRAQEEGVALECVRGDARPMAEMRELVEGILAAARVAAGEARAGKLQARPSTCGFGGSGCAYPSICRCG